MTGHSPGANRLRQLPMFDMLAMLSLSVIAPTVMALGALAGDIVQLSPPLLLPAQCGGKTTGSMGDDHTHMIIALCVCKHT